MDYEHYIHNYTGSNVTVAIIDSGVDISSKSIEHIRIHDGMIVNYSPYKIEDLHGTYCALEILKKAPDIKLIDINVSENSKVISEKNVIRALKEVLRRRVDIINISLSFDRFSEEMLTLCNEIYDSNILICAAIKSGNNFPASFTSVIGVKNDEVSTINFEKGSMTIAIQNKMYDYQIREKHSTLEASSSLACAECTGILSCFLEGDVLNQEKKHIEELGLNIKETVNIDNQNEMYVVVEPSINQILIERYINIIDEYCVGFYDYKDNKINFIPGRKTDDYFLCEINKESYMRKTILNRRQFLDRRILRLGSFENYDDKTMKIEKYSSNYCKYINRPILYIASLGIDSSKVKTMLELRRQACEKDVLLGTITFNPIGRVFESMTFQYPEKVIYPNIVHTLNNIIYECAQNVDLVLVDIPGGMSKLNIHNENDYGAMYKAFIEASDIDFLIIMINNGVKLSLIEKEVERAKLSGVLNIICIISDKAYDPMTFESSNGIIALDNSMDAQLELAGQLRKILRGVKVFIYNDLVNGNVIDYIFSLYE